MKRYEDPIINVSLFDIENIVTTSGGAGPSPVETAVDQATAAATTLVEGSRGTLTVTF